MSSEDQREIKEAAEELTLRCHEFKRGDCGESDVDIASRMYNLIVDLKIKKMERELAINNRNPDQAE